jgi:hypothetical protein
MRKFLLLALAILTFSLAPDAEAQINRRSIKKNNKRISAIEVERAGLEKRRFITWLAFL